MYFVPSFASRPREQRLKAAADGVGKKCNMEFISSMGILLMRSAVCGEDVESAAKHSVLETFVVWGISECKSAVPEGSWTLDT
jgi:hypothetical protein